MMSDGDFSIITKSQLGGDQTIFESLDEQTKVDETTI
jgi:hypothetical protein